MLIYLHKKWTCTHKRAAPNYKVHLYPNAKRTYPESSAKMAAIKSEVGLESKWHVVTPSLLEKLTIHPVSLWLNLGMEEWADTCTYFESLKQLLSASWLVRTTVLATTMSYCPSYDLNSHAPTSVLAVVLPLQPHPQWCCSSQRSQPNPQEPSAKKPHFTTLSNEELEGLSKH